ncbi:MAG: cobalt-zinc-cadmium efflux system outer membrane protein [Gammaproteobacteria bacterium]|jgi:cobalt-zinc-cadmium efflux system outer membrane protein
MFIQNRSLWSQTIFTVTLIFIGIANLAYGASSGVHQNENQSAQPLANGSPLLTLADAIDRALADNPNLAEMQARAEAFAAIPSQVGTLPDPILSFNAMNLPTNTFDLSQEPMTQTQFGINQAFPFPGKLGLREEAAQYEAEAAAKDVDETRFRLLRDVKTTWWAVFNLDKAQEIVLRNQALLRQFIQIAQTKYRVGKGLQQDVLLAQLELSKLLDLDLRLEGARRSEAARLNALLSVPPDQPAQLPRDVSLDLPRLKDEKAFYQLADQYRPLLATQESIIQASRSRVELAKKDYYPDFNVGAAYGIRSGDDIGRGSRADLASFRLSMNLPIFTGRKQSKAVSQRRSEMLQQTFKLRDLRNFVQADISKALADYQRARDRFELFKTGILPQARQTVASMLAGYQVNKVDFLNLVSAQVTEYNYEISYWQMLSEANQALARLVAAVGVENINE